MSRISLKIVGASGQGINSIGAIIAKGLKRSGYCVFGYREYPSLIKGGHASYQLDVSNQRICSTETKVNVLVALNHHGLELNVDELKQEGISREFVNRVQNLRKDKGFEVTDKISVRYKTNGRTIIEAIENNLSYICAEILADTIQLDNQLNMGDTVLIDEHELLIYINKI